MCTITVNGQPYIQYKSTITTNSHKTGEIFGVLFCCLFALFLFNNKKTTFVMILVFSEQETFTKQCI